MRHENRPREPTPPRTPTAPAMDKGRLREEVQSVLMQLAFSKDRESLLTALGVVNTSEETHDDQGKPTNTTGQTGSPYTDVEGYELPRWKRESKKYEHLNKDTMESPSEGS